jgi:hypothetical protein
MTCFRLPHPRMPHEHCFSAPFVSIIAPWHEVTDIRSQWIDRFVGCSWQSSMAITVFGPIVFTLIMNNCHKTFESGRENPGPTRTHTVSKHPWARHLNPTFSIQEYKWAQELAWGPATHCPGWCTVCQFHPPFAHLFPNCRSFPQFVHLRGVILLVS